MASRPIPSHRAHPPTILLLAFWLAFLAALARASSSGAPGGSGGTPPPPVPEDMASETVALPLPPGARLPVSWEVDDVPTLSIYPDDVPRYFARRWVSADVSWISPNSPTRGILLPPNSRGARPCGCYDLQGRQTSVYGQLENAPMWPWLADWYLPSEPARPYAANIWEGMGPCARLQLDSVLHRFPAHRSHDGEQPWFWIADAALREMEQQDTLDESMIPLLFPAARIATLPRVESIVYEGAQDLSLLRSRWAAWVRSLLVRRTLIIFEIVARFAGRALRMGSTTVRQRFERLRERRYFGRCPQGAWFDDVIGSAGIIRQFIMEGVPVYYRWEASYETLPFLADLAPPEGPLPGSPRYFPPPTPRRTGPGGSIAHGPAWHYDSYRIPPTAAVGRDGYPEAMDDITLHQLVDLDPHRAPPAHVMPAEDDRDERRRRSSGSSSLSWGSSMDYDYESPPRAPAAALVEERETRDPVAGPALLQRMGDEVTGEPSRAATPESPTVEMLRRAENAPPPAVPLAARITDSEPAPNVAPRLPSILDFLREGDGNAERGPFVPLPSRQIHPRVPDWGLLIRESADSSAASAYYARRENGELQAATEQLEFAFRRGMAYLTGIEFPRDQLIEGRELSEAVPEGDDEAHAVPLNYRLTRDTPPQRRLYQWVRGIRLVLSRPHARAALAQGGIIWRLARWAGLTLAHAMDGPSQDVREEGSRRVVIIEGDNGPFAAVDDWLSDEEVNTILGVVIDQSQSIWPDALILGRNWWQGEWTEAHEQWFQETIRSMFANRHRWTTQSRAQFRDELRSRDHQSNGAGRHGRNRAGN